MSENLTVELTDAPGAEGAPDGVTVRVMEEGDLPAVVAIDEAAGGRERRTFYEERLAACLREPGLNTSLVAEREDRPVGFLMGKVFFGEFGIPIARAVLDALAVRPDCGRRGIGRALVEQYQKNLSALRVEAIDTLVDWDRFDLLAFFSSLGFRPRRNVDLVWDIVRYPFAAGACQARVRPAEQRDLLTVAEIDREATQISRSFYFSTRLGSALNWPEKNLFVVAELDGEVAGYTVGSLYRGEFGIDEVRGVIDAFAVREAFRHRGVASALMAFLLERAERLGVRQMETLCRWNDWELLQFFEYVGFRPRPRINLEWRVPE
jgi:predicted N-acetyltransferase YhbS